MSLEQLSQCRDAIRHAFTDLEYTSVVTGCVVNETATRGMRVRYFGETKNGETIDFEISGGQIRDIRSMVHVLCTEVGGSLRTNFEIQPFQLAGPFEIEGSGHFSGTNRIEGKEHKFIGQVHGSEASGTLGLTYWKMTFDPFTNRSGQILCKNEVEWSASSVDSAN